VTELYGDTRSGASPAAVMTIQFGLVDTTDPRAATVYQRTISQRVPMAQATPDALVRGYGAALSQILVQLSSDLASLPVGGAGAAAQAPASSR